MLRALLAAVLLSSALAVHGADLSRVPFLDGERNTGSMNRFGGEPQFGERLSFRFELNSSLARSGEGALSLRTTEPITTFGYVFVRLNGANVGSGYRDGRDLTPFSALTFWARNATGSPLTLGIEIKDYRASNGHRARKSFAVNAASGWIEYTVPLDLAQLEVTGSPNLARARLITFIVEANFGSTVAGDIFLDDMVLTEKGGSLDIDTAPVSALVDRIAQRQFRGLWGVRDPDNGLVLAQSAYSDVAAMNSLAGLLQILPTAVERGWVTQAEADAWVQQIANVLAALSFTYVPARYVNPVSLQANYVVEESSVDAAMLYLALYRYKSLAGAPPALKTQIETQLARFDFAAFSSPGGWRLAYRPDGFTPGTYDGYSGEVWLISLAAHLSQTHHVGIAAHFHSGINRTRTFLVDSTRAHVVHTSADFRPPFVQWLLSLFVKTSNRGVDTYPNASLATNPHDNAVLYQLEVHAKAAALNRATRLQPDAGDDGTSTFYRQFSLYNDFGKPDLVMPWSAAFGFLADAPAAGAALREILRRDLHGPLGLADSARWPANAVPVAESRGNDFWNVALSAMALLEYRFGGSEDLAALPEVAAALSTVLAARTFSPAITHGIVIAASHFRDLRSRIDVLRARYGLGAFPWTPALTSAATTIAATHLTDLRTAVNQILLAIGQPAQPWSTDPNAVRGSAVASQHVNDLRSAILALEP